jgi:hypothetical protein
MSGKKHSAERCDVLRQRNLKNYRKNYVFQSPDGILVRTHHLIHIAKEYGVSDARLSAIVHGRRKHHRGWTFVGFED